MPLQRRVPKGGFRSKSHRMYQLVNLDDLERRFSDNSEVNLEDLRQMGLIGKQELPVKILAGGEITKVVVVHAHACSEAARQKIEGAGGRVEIISL